MFCLLLCDLLADGCAQNEENDDGHYNADGQANPCVLNKACDDEVNEAEKSNGKSIGKLSLNMLDVVAVCACGSHDGGVGDG